MRDWLRVGGRRVSVVARAITCAGAFFVIYPDGAEAQARSYASAPLPASHDWEFRRVYREAGGLVAGGDLVLNSLFSRMASRNGDDPRVVEAVMPQMAARILSNPPDVVPLRTAGGDRFARLAPQAAGMIDWGNQFSRQIYDVWSDPRLTLAERDGRITSLVSHYRRRADLAVSVLPKSIDVMDAQLYSLAFRKKFPVSNAMLWGSQWLQAAMYEPLLSVGTADDRNALVVAALRRFRQMMREPIASAPRLIPLTPAVAPSFARRYPEAGAILDNMHMMSNVFADILASPEIPRSAKGKEILLAAGVFRSDTALSIPYEAWLRMSDVMGVSNMGGTPGGPVGVPTVERGTSMAGVVAEYSQHDSASHSGSMSGMPADPDAAGLLAIYERMMADPVIRERVATDPVLQRMIREVFPTGGATMPGMDDMAGMPGMTASDDRQRALEFIVRLFSDPSVAGKIQGDPELRRLWSDPEVQRRLRELQSSPTALPPRVPAPPQPAPAPAHKH
jgi:hypothetical protein